jgi:hypothetical protein
MKDLEWMIDNWKKLKGIHGGLNKDPDVNAQLKGTVSLTAKKNVLD